MTKKKELAEVKETQAVTVEEIDRMFVRLADSAAGGVNLGGDIVEVVYRIRTKLEDQRKHNSLIKDLVDMQGELPVINLNGVIKNRHGKEQSRYALWEDINEGIKPVLAKHGFVLTFRVETSPDYISVTGILDHTGGGSRSSHIGLPMDSSGSKNAVQSYGSSISYGKRYVAQALLNLTCAGEDDDGAASSVDIGFLDKDTQERLRSELNKVSGNEKLFLKNLGVESWDRFPAKQYERANMLIKRKREQSKLAGVES